MCGGRRRDGRRRRVVAELLDGGVNRAVEAQRQGGGARRSGGRREVAERREAGRQVRDGRRRKAAERKWSCTKAATARLLGNCGSAVGRRGGKRAAGRISFNVGA